MHRFQIFSPAYELRDFVKNYFVTGVSDAGDLPSTTFIYPMNIPALNFLGRQGIYQYANSDGDTIQASAITIIDN
jgi:hypothetical protein